MSCSGWIVVVIGFFFFFFFFFLLGSGKFSFKSILMSCMLKVRYEMSDELWNDILK